jgi:hypothetical protein
MLYARALLALVILCPWVKASTQPLAVQNSALFFLDNQEISYAAVRKMDPFKIDSTLFIKAIDAVKQYGEKGRFGVVKIFSRRAPISFKEGHFRLTLYYHNDTTKFVRMRSYSGGKLADLLNFIVKEHDGFELMIDDLRNADSTQDHQSLLVVAGAFNLIHANVQTDSVSKSMAEVLYYGYKIYGAGRFYFSGEGFRNTMSCTASDITCVRNNINRCAPGSIIIMEGCKTRINGKEEVINKVMKLY